MSSRLARSMTSGAGLRAQVASFRDTAARRITDPDSGRGFPGSGTSDSPNEQPLRNTTVRRWSAIVGRIALNIEDHKRPLISYKD